MHNFQQPLPVELKNNIFVRQVRVHRSRTAEEAINATGRQQRCDPNILRSMPRGIGAYMTVSFFNVGILIDDIELEKKYATEHLRAADPYTLAAVNEVDPAFADEYPNITHWKGDENAWYFMAFRPWRTGRGVGAARRVSDYCPYWWFAGIPILYADNPPA